MIRRRVWRDAPLPEGSITLGSPISANGVPRAAPRVDIVMEHERTRRELQQSEVHTARLEAELQVKQSRLEEAQRNLEERDAILNELGASLESERERARQEGFAIGLEQAQASAHHELQSELMHWRGSLEELQRANEARWQALRAELAEAVMASIARLLGEQMTSPHAARAAVEQTLKDSGVASPLRVLLAPAQYEQLIKTGGAQLAWFKERRLEIAPDARVTHGGCLLETQSGLIDGRFEAQLQRLHDIVATHYGGSAR